MDMGLGNLPNAIFKRKFRWLFFVDGIIGDGINVLPPSKASRPTLSFKSQSFEHLNETISYPVKPEWKPCVAPMMDLKLQKSI